MWSYLKSELVMIAVEMFVNECVQESSATFPISAAKQKSVLKGGGAGEISGTLDLTTYDSG